MRGHIAFIACCTTIFCYVHVDSALTLATYFKQTVKLYITSAHDVPPPVLLPLFARDRPPLTRPLARMLLARLPPDLELPPLPPSRWRFGDVGVRLQLLWAAPAPFPLPCPDTLRRLPVASPDGDTSTDTEPLLAVL